MLGDYGFELASKPLTPTFQHRLSGAGQPYASQTPSPRQRFRGLPLPYRSSALDSRSPDQESPRRFFSHVSPRDGYYADGAKEYGRNSFSTNSDDKIQRNEPQVWNVILSRVASKAAFNSSYNSEVELENDHFFLPLMPSLNAQVKALREELRLSPKQCLAIELFLEIETGLGQQTFKARLTEASWPSMFGRFLAPPQEQRTSPSTRTSSLFAGSYSNEGAASAAQTNVRMGFGMAPQDGRGQGAGLTASAQDSNEPARVDNFARQSELPLPPLAANSGLPIAAKLFYDFREPRYSSSSVRSSVMSTSVLASHDLSNPIYRQGETHPPHLRALSLAQAFPLMPSNQADGADRNSSVDQDVQSPETKDDSESHDWLDASSNRKCTWGSSNTSFDSMADADGAVAFGCEKEQGSSPELVSAFASPEPSPAESHLEGGMFTQRPGFSGRRRVPESLGSIALHHAASSLQSLSSQFLMNPLGIVIPDQSKDTSDMTRPRAATTWASYGHPKLSLGLSGEEPEQDESSMPTPRTMGHTHRRAVTEHNFSIRVEWSERWDEAANQLRERVAGQPPSSPAGFFYESWAEFADGDIDGQLGEPAAEETGSGYRHRSLSINSCISYPSSLSSLEVPHEDDWPSVENASVTPINLGTFFDFPEEHALENHQQAACFPIQSQDSVPLSEHKENVDQLRDDQLVGDPFGCDATTDESPETPRLAVDKGLLPHLVADGKADDNASFANAWAELARRMQSPGALRLICLAASEWPTKSWSTPSDPGSLSALQPYQNDIVRSTSSQQPGRPSWSERKPNSLFLHAPVSSRPRALSSVFDISPTSPVGPSPVATISEIEVKIPTRKAPPPSSPPKTPALDEPLVCLTELATGGNQHTTS